MSKLLKQRIERLEKQEPKIESEPLNLSEFSLEEQAILTRAIKVANKMDAGLDFSTISYEDRKALVAGAEIERVYREKQALEVTNDGR